MRSRKVIAIDIGRRRFRALQASRNSDGLTITRTVVDDLPADVTIDDPEALGEWVGERLRTAGFSRAPATVALGREHVGLKRITLPTTEESELAEMTRLAMLRELPFDAESAVIDYVPVERGGASTTVLAVAVPRPVIENARRVARAAGLKVERIALRTMGAAALIKSEVSGGRCQVSGEDRSQDSTMALDTCHLTPDTSSSGIAIDITGEGVEFAVVTGGTIQFSRAAEVPHPQDQLAIAEAVVTEARRTWMSYRIGDDSPGVERAVIMGERRVSHYAAGPLAEMLKVQVEVLEAHPRVRTAARGRGEVRAGAVDMDQLWPLAGLLLEPVLNGRADLVNFARPRKPPDPAAQARTRRLLAAGLALVALLGGFTFARRDLAEKQREAERLTTQSKEGVTGYARYWRDHYRLDHLQQWDSVGVDWLKHASYLSEIAPPPEQVVFDSWTGTLSFPGVTYDAKTGKWAATQEMVIVIDGEALDRKTADGFRDTLMQNPVYTTSTTGADAIGGRRMPFGFTYRLRSLVPAPTARTVAPDSVGPEAAAAGGELDDQPGAAARVGGAGGAQPSQTANEAAPGAIVSGEGGISP